ncbi:hypothetical protein MPER_09829, partial [Moniliophthora perniciosa FA553]
CMLSILFPHCIMPCVPGKAFFRYTEHPPDAQRGWDLPPAVMPYNVIIFTCSIVAFIFGSIFNLLSRKFVVVNVDAQPQEGRADEKQEENIITDGL